MKRSIILAALILSMAVTVFAEEELIWEGQAATEDVAYAESVFEEETTSEEQTVSEEPSYVFEETVEEQTTEEEVAEIAFDENVEQEENVEESIYEEQIVTEETAAAADTSVVAVEGLVYTGLPQELITPQPGSWLYSLDGETYSEELPMGVNAGDYTVYMKEGETVETLTVTIAKADVVNITPPVAPSPVTTSEAVPAAASEAASAGKDAIEGVEEEPAYAAGDEPDVVVFEDLS